MMSEVNALSDLIAKVANFVTQLQDGWYKESAEVDCFRNKVRLLSAKHNDWRNQLRRHGVSQDENLLPLLKVADDALGRQQQYVQELPKSWWFRHKRKAFPTELSYYVDKLFEIVDAGPAYVAESVADNEVLVKYMSQTPTPLPFGPDPNYVPIADSIAEVRSALDNAGEPRVVTVFGGPGMGKSSLAKYLALYYQEHRVRFSDGVHYLFCGHNAQVWVKQLELLDSLGFGSGTSNYATPVPAPVGGVQGEYLTVLTNRRKLMSRLSEQKLLIVVDDLWEEKVLQEVLVPAKGVRYLVTSQISDIWGPARKIHLKDPTKTQACQIMANYVDGLPIKGKFPANLQDVAGAISRRLEYHPLSLANVGLSIHKSRATDESQWELIEKNINVHLDENDFRKPVGHDTPYNLAVSASMMLMVESLPPESQRLLYLLALFERAELPENLVKVFFKVIQPCDHAAKFSSQEKFLEDRSLVELRIPGKRSFLHTRHLRTHYIRKNKTPEMRSIASQILAVRSDQDVVKIIERGDAEETLRTILSAWHYDRSFKEVVASSLENHIKILNDGVLPRSLNRMGDTLDLVESARRYKIQHLVELLKDVDPGEAGWEHQAHEYAKKIIIKFVCQGKLDDSSMARLLQLPQTTSAACAALSEICRHYYRQDFRDTFSFLFPETIQTLLTLYHKGTISTEPPPRYALLDVLDYKNSGTRRFALRITAFPNALQMLFNFFISEDMFVSDHRHVIQVIAGNILSQLSYVPENRTKFGAVEGIWKGLGDILAKLEEAWRAIRDTKNRRRKLEERAYTAALILGSLGLEKDFRKTITSLPGVREGLLFLQLIEMARQLEQVARDWIYSSSSGDWHLSSYYSIRALTVLYCDPADPRSTNLPPSGDVLEIIAFDQGPQSKAMAMASSEPDICQIFYFSMYWTRVLTYVRMGSYAESLLNLDLANHHLNLISELGVSRDIYCQIHSFRYIIGTPYSPATRVLRDCRIFAQAKLRHSAGALLAANRRFKQDKPWPLFSVIVLAQGVFKRLSGNLQGALDDLNAAAMKVPATYNL